MGTSSNLPCVSGQATGSPPPVSGARLLVVACSDDVQGSAVTAPEELLEGLVVDVQRRLHPVREELPQRARA